MNIKITADSTCDLSAELVQRYNVGVMPLAVVLGEKIYRDGVDITPWDIFQYVSQNGVLPKSSAPSVEEYSEFFTAQLADCDAIVHFNISSKASSSHENAARAAQDKQFKSKVLVVDSHALSTGQGLLVLKACDLAREGRSPKDIAEITTKLRDKVNTSFVPDALDYLHKGGRCSLAALMGAKILKLHPFIDMKDGRLYAKKKYMGGIERCLKAYVDELAQQYKNYDKARCFITHSSCGPETVAKVRSLVEQLFGFDEIYETVAGNVVTSHCGKGTLGVLFIYE